MTLDSPLKLDRANAIQHADVAAEQHCYRTALAFLDICEALIVGTDNETMLVLYDRANYWSAVERAADLYQGNDPFSRDQAIRNYADRLSTGAAHRITDPLDRRIAARA